MVRVLVVDDYAAWRRFAARTLLVRPDVEIVGEAETGKDGIAKVKELLPDVVVLDVGLPDSNGFDVARSILELAPKTRIIFLTQYASREMAEEAMRFGARGYVLKVNAGELLPALEAALAGDIFISPGLDPHR